VSGDAGGKKLAPVDDQVISRFLRASFIDILLKPALAKVLQGSYRTSWAFPGFCPPTSHDSNAQAGQAVRVATPERRRIGF